MCAQGTRQKVHDACLCALGAHEKGANDGKERERRDREERMQYN